jgi:hypothetical protein
MTDRLHKDPAEVVDEVVELGDPYKIDYALLPDAPARPERELSLWELFRLAWNPGTPKFPPQSEATLVRRRK